MITRIIKYFTSSYDETKKVIWPNRQEVTSHSIIVISSIVISMGIISLIDYGLFNFIQFLINRG